MGGAAIGRAGRRRRDEDGAIAILALWAVAIVFIILGAASFATRTEIQIARNAIASSQARHAAEAGAALGLARLLARRTQGDLDFDGHAQLWEDGPIGVTISIQDEAGKIDLNQAPLDLLAGLFATVSPANRDGVRLACLVVIARGGADDRCAGMTQAAAAPRPDHAFVAPEEVALFPGIGDIYPAIADCVTVATGAGAIDPLVAPARVMRALPDSVGDLARSYRTQAFAGDGLGAGTLPSSPYLTTTPGRDFTVTAVARTADGARYRADLQVRLTGIAARPYEVVAWRVPML